MSSPVKPPGLGISLVEVLYNKFSVLNKYGNIFIFYFILCLFCCVSMYAKILGGHIYEHKVVHNSLLLTFYYSVEHQIVNRGQDSL